MFLECRVGHQIERRGHFFQLKFRQSSFINKNIITFVIFNQIKRMSNRKTWTAQEDDILRQLYETKAIKKWSTISLFMAKHYHIEGRSGKQCRQRYHNHLKRGINKEMWTEQQQQKLVQLHSIHGNKWALISKLITRRTQNCVKNMFNSKLRKSVRLLNRFIYLYYRKSLKEIKNSFVNRLSEFSQAAYKKPEDQRNQEQQLAIQIKNQVLSQDDYEVHQMTEAQKSKGKSLVEQIHSFKKDNCKYYRGNVLARLRRQKTRRKHSNESIKMQEIKQQTANNKQNSISEQVESTRKGNMKEKDNKKGNMKEKDNIKQSNLARQEDYLQFVRQDNNVARPADVVGGSIPVHRKLSVHRPDSLQSNQSAILLDQMLERPIQVENYMHNMTPTLKYNSTDFMDWTRSLVDWRFNAE